MIPLIVPLIMFLGSLYKMLKQPEFKSFFVLVLITLIFGSVAYHFIEGWSWLDSFYFSVIALTTIGFGDFAPTTDLGKVFTIIYVFIGLGILLGFVNASAEYFRRRQKERVSRRRKIHRRNPESNMEVQEEDIE